MNIHFHGDHRRSHCGSRAVSQYIKHIIINSGHTITCTKNAEVVLINGEGTIHDDKPAAIAKLQFGVNLKKTGRKVFLINTVWQNMTHPIINEIKMFDGVYVREDNSYNEIKSIYPDAKKCIDLAYFLDIDKPKLTYTDHIYGGSFHRIPYISSLREMREINIWDFKTWSEYLNSLSTCKVLYTGFHHAIIAACKLRIPFVAYRGNTDKVAGIMKTANVNIPVANNAREFIHNMKNMPPIGEYNKLFDYMEQRKPFSLSDIL
jgi:hypothetical protein